MSQNFVKYGKITIHFPDETLNGFSIYEDLADYFGVEYQSEAVTLLKKELKSHADIKPKPRIDSESGGTGIDSRSADTIFKVVEIINSLAINEFQVTLSEKEREEILGQMKAWKRPKKKAWSVGDVFSMELKDGSFMFGQIIGWQTIDSVNFGSPTCAMFELRKTTAILNITELKESKIIAVHNTSSEYLDKGVFPVLFGTELLANSNGVDQYSSIGDQHLLDLGNAYYGLEPWNVWAKENYFDKMLCADIPRPKTALILDTEARNKYRLEHFGVDENNQYVNQVRNK
jgi:hypothetical protein